MGDASSIARHLQRKKWVSWWGGAKLIESVLRGIGQPCFANNPISGTLILIGLFIGNFMSGVAAIICSLVAIITAKLLNQPNNLICCGASNFNAVVVGSVSAHLYPIFFHSSLTINIWIYIVTAAILSVFIWSGLSRITARHNLPTLNLPFNIVVSVMFLCFKSKGFGVEHSDIITDITPSKSISPDIHWDQLFRGSLLSAGLVYGVESIGCSILVLTAVFISSPLLSIFSYLGGLISTLSALAVVDPHSYRAIYLGVWGFNGFLSAASVGYFVVPSCRSALLASANSVFTAAVQAALHFLFLSHHMPVLAIPFCISSFLFLSIAAGEGVEGGGFAWVSGPTFPEDHIFRKYLVDSPEKKSQTLTSSFHAREFRQMIYRLLSPQTDVESPVPPPEEVLPQRFNSKASMAPSRAPSTLVDIIRSQSQCRSPTAAWTTNELAVVTEDNWTTNELDVVTEDVVASAWTTNELDVVTEDNWTTNELDVVTEDNWSNELDVVTEDVVASAWTTNELAVVTEERDSTVSAVLAN